MGHSELHREPQKRGFAFLLKSSSASSSFSLLRFLSSLLSRFLWRHSWSRAPQLGCYQGLAGDLVGTFPTSCSRWKTSISQQFDGLQNRLTVWSDWQKNLPRLLNCGTIVNISKYLMSPGSLKRCGWFVSIFLNNALATFSCLGWIVSCSEKTLSFQMKISE